MKIEAARARKEFASFVNMAKAGEEIIIIRHGEPLAKLIPFRSKSAKQADISDIKDFVGMRKTDPLDGVTQVNEMRRKSRHEISD